MCTDISCRGICDKTLKTVLRLHSQKQLNSSFVTDSAVINWVPHCCAYEATQSREFKILRTV
jgi:hypothetical protein